ncbi:MAG: hypothetical protein IIW17_04065 [Clostridia bacterium]|nr:hypothetical protein [Clostridia bacterium]MBQ5793172.1 hypothetical protein [Clostridia bacterium]
MKHKAFKRIFAALACVLLCVLAVMPVLAAFDPPLPWEGSVSGGVFVVDGESELAVEQAELRFDASDLLEYSYADAQELLEYGARVTATYTLYNPTDHTVTEQLATPISSYPYSSQSIPEGVDAEKFTVAINGSQITPQLRHVFTAGKSYYVSTANTQRSDVYMPNFGLAYLSDTLLSRSVFTPDAPVYVYTYHAEVDEGEKENSFFASADIQADPQSCALFASWYMYDGASDGNVVSVSKNVYLSEDFSICSVGKPLETVVWTTETYKGKAVKASVLQTSVSQMTLYEYVLQGYDTQSGISEQDYFNAFLAFTENYARDDSAFVEVGVESPLPVYNLQPWQLFSVELEPGERMRVTVTAPLYPSLYDRYDPPIYIYAYAMAHMDEWSAFGQTRVQLVTPYYLLDQQRPMPNDNAYTKTENGYLWEGQAEFPYLVFSTCENQDPSDGSFWIAVILSILMILFLFVVFVLPWVILALVVILIVLLIIRKVKKNKKIKAEQQGKTPPAEQDTNDATDEKEDHDEQTNA